MRNGKKRSGVSMGILSAVGVLTAVFLLNAGQATASIPTEFSTNASVSESVDTASPVEVVGAQALRDSIPASLFPVVAQTLQSNGPSDIYRATPSASSEPGYRLDNPPHSVSAEFSTRAVRISSGETGEWTWSIKLAGYGRGRAVGSTVEAKLTANGNRVEYLYPDGLTEWYVNGQLGLQQGFTFESRPSPLDEGALEVRLALFGDVTVEVKEGGASALLRPHRGRDTLRYGGLYAYDADGKELGVRLEAMPKALSILVDDAGAQYPITIDPFIEKDYLSGSAEDPRQKFGQSVAVSGDTVVVGTPSHHWEDTKGAAYVFTIPEGGDPLLPGSVVLTSPRAMEGDVFGFSVAISGDTIVVGAPCEGIDEQGNRTCKGTAYVFTKPPEGWMSSSVGARLTAPDASSVDPLLGGLLEQVGGQLTAPDAPPATWFGTSVAVSGETVVVGAPGNRYVSWEEVPTAAYVFTKPTEGWTDTSDAAKLTPPGDSMDSKFGHSVAVSGDTVVVGAHLADGDDDEEDVGAAYVFVKPSGGWTDTSDSVELMAPDGAKGREFGWSVALNNDTLVVGAPYTGEFIVQETYREAYDADDKTPYLGSAYVFTRSASGWEDAPDPAKFTASNGIPWTQFGWSVSISGDTIVVGAPGVRWSLQHRGAYVFTKPSEGWYSASEQRALPGLDSRRSFYGSSVDISGDVIVVGASDDSNENGPNAGSAFLFTMPTDGWNSKSPLTDPAKLMAFDGPAGDRFGHAVALEGETLVVGVPGNHDTERGRANVFMRRGNDWDYFRVLTAPDGAQGAQFGSSVAVSDNTFVVGAPGRLGGDAPGAAYVFIRPDDQWGREYTVTYNVKLTMPDGAADGQFGYSVAVQGDVVVVGAPGAGAAYVYTKPTSGWTLAPTQAKLAPPEGVSGGRFGHAVAIAGDSILVGAPDGDDGNKTGVIYVFTMPYSGWEDTSDSVKIRTSDGEVDNRLGNSISAVGDTVVAGAPGPESGDGEGAVYILTKPNTGWEPTTATVKLTASDGGAGDRFGHAVSFSDEFIVVGAHGKQEGSGAVYAFRRPEDGWRTTSDAYKLTGGEGAPGGLFGYAVSTSGDALAVGSPGDVVLPHSYLEGGASGAARVYTWPGLHWVDTPDAFKLRPPNAETSRIFGVAFSADGNTVAVGTVAEGAEQSTARTAEVSVYKRRAGAWDTLAPATLTLPDGDGDEPRGLAVSENGDTVVVGLSSHDPGSPLRLGAALVFTRPEDGWVSTSETARLTIPDGSPEDAFGQMVAISGNAIVVGASGDDNGIGTRNTGSAYVFTKPAGGWVSMTAAAKLTAPAGNDGDRFGGAVSIVGDTIVIGAPGDRDLNGNQAGSAYVFTKPSGGWVSTSESAKLVAPDGWSEDWSGNEFGSSVSIMGDKIAVGAPGHAGGFGAAYVFSRPDGGWTNPYIVTKFTAPEFEWELNFGASVSMIDDAVFVGAPGSRYSDKPGEVFIFPIPAEQSALSGEPVRLSDPHGAIDDAFGGVVSAGGNALAVMALASDDHGQDAGTVYIFSEPLEGWDFLPAPKRHAAKLVSPDSDMGGLFGLSLSTIDGTVAVGAPRLEESQDQGTTYLFTRTSENWLSGDDAVRFTPPEGDASSLFGWSVSLTSDTMAVGAPVVEERQSAVYMFTKPDEGWVSTSEAAKLTSPRREEDNLFGISVSVFDGTAVVGSVREDGRGSVYLFMRPDGGPWRSTSNAIELTPPGAEDSSLFGWSVAITDEIIVVGMPSEEGLGAAYVYTKPEEGWPFVQDPVKLTPPDGNLGDWFGVSVAVSGDTVVVVARDCDYSADPGAAYVFTKPPTGWAATSDSTKLMAPNGSSGNLFGWSVAVSGNTVVVGAGDTDENGAAFGAYVFARPGGGWGTDPVTPVMLPIDDSTEIGPLGVSVVIAGKTVVIGAPRESDPGAVYVFEEFIDE